MLKNTLLAICLLTFSIANTQTNLEYAETIKIDLSGTTSTNFLIASLNVNVPVGQTWKIESVMLSRKSVSGATRDYQPGTDMKLLLDDNLFFVNNSGSQFKFPYWLESGNHLFEILYTNTWNPAYTGRATLSVLVFNIIEP
jgi:hypothetical protein